MSKKKPTDDELITAIRTRKDQLGWAIDYIYKAWFKFAQLNVLLMPGTRQDVEEVFQDALMALIENIGSGKYKKQDKAKLKTYFLKLFKNRYQNYKRATKKRQVTVPFEVSKHDRPILKEEGNYYKEQLKIHLKKLSEECQKLIHLHGLGYTYEDIVEKVGQSLPTIKRKVPNCRKKLYLLANPERN